MEAASLRLLLLLSVIVALSAQTVGNLDCISTYQDLKTSVINNPNNTQSLLVSFYPPNESPAHVVNVFYHVEERATMLDVSDDNETMFPNFEQPNTTADYIFQWVDSSTLLLTEIRLFQALSFYIAQLTISNVTIVLPPFCDQDEAVSLLNTLTVWLKSYAVGTDETSRYYSLYFNDEKFVTLNNITGDSASALVACEYAASVGWIIAIYTFLLLAGRENPSDTVVNIVKFFSQMSPQCVAVVLTIVIYDINSYATQFQYSTSEWLRAFPIPIIFVVFSVVNLPLAIAFVAKDDIDGDSCSFPLPGLLQLIYEMWDTQCQTAKEILFRVLKVILIFSITSIAILGVFHVAWVLFAFSSYPVRSIASQAFIIPFIIVIFVVLLLMDYSAISQSRTKNGKQSNSDFFKHLILLLVMCAPLVITLLGVLYYYSQALVEVNDAEDNPFKSILAAVAPAAATTVFLWLAGLAIKKIETEAAQHTSTANTEHEKKNDISSSGCSCLKSVVTKEKIMLENVECEDDATSV